MDHLGCLDLGCLDKKSTDSNTNIDACKNKESDSSCENVTSATKTGKSRSPRGNSRSPRGNNGQPALNALNKFTSQIKKPPHRSKNSPITWFPRKKVESYLKRKIKMLQEIDGMKMTLDETLGDSNPHYCKILREKIAAREAADAAMEARKAALVEASWCKILKAARIQCKETEEVLVKAEKTAAEAFEAATALGVIMYDQPNCPRQSSKVETSSVDGGKLTTHTVTASFETAFDVDKEVAAAVKSAFIRLSSCPSFDKDEFRELLSKIRQNPDKDDQEVSEFSSECDSESESELETMPRNDVYSAQGNDSRLPAIDANLKKNKNRQPPEKLTKTKFEDMMLERLRCLKEDELSSLATIVATCGLNAALAEAENYKLHDTENASDCTSSFNGPRRMSNFPRRMSTAPRRMSNAGIGFRTQVEPELPSLDKFLVKHVTKLEREVLEAKNRRNETVEENIENSDKNTSNEMVPDLGSILVKHMSKLEKEVEEAKKNSNKDFGISHKKPVSDLNLSEEIPDLGGILTKHSSKLEKDVQQSRKKTEQELEADNKKSERASNRVLSRRKEDVSDVPSLDKFLVKHVSRLEKEVQEAKNRTTNTDMNTKEPRKAEQKENIDMNKKEDSLDKILVKPVHRIEKEKMQFSLKEEMKPKPKTTNRNMHTQMNEEGSLDQILVKHKSRLEREKITATTLEPEEQIRISAFSRRQARERELQEAWGGLSLGNSIKPHVSKLEKDKAAWIKAEEEERRGDTEDLIA